MIAVIFEVEPRTGAASRYFGIAAALKADLESVDGIISVERFESIPRPGCYLSLSFWRDEAAVRSWLCHGMHRQAQQEGRSDVLVGYRLRVATVVRDYGKLASALRLANRAHLTSVNTPHESRLARVAALVADSARSRRLAYLPSGEYASASELAKVASVTPATASGYLGKLLDAQFVFCEPRGRHRYYRLAAAEVAHALQALALVAERGEHDRAWTHPERKRLRVARCGYGHLAGPLAVMVFDALQREDRLISTTDGYELTDAGRRWLQGLGMSPGSPSGRRRFAYRCLDWSERRDHLAGQLADKIYQHLPQAGWLRRAAGRAVEITLTGKQELLPRLNSNTDAN
jgi:heme-degrading monooxygenase HmoA/DNA-binding transcriptional ArsR family regulator